MIGRKWRGAALASGRSARWAFMERFVVPDYGDDDTDYLTRWRVIQTPWAAVYLHKLGGPDPRATLHDHPWAFLSVVLRGGYVERRLDPVTMQVDENHQVRWFNGTGRYKAEAPACDLNCQTVENEWQAVPFGLDAA